MPTKQNTTQNIVTPNNDLEVLKKSFPHCFDKDGDFDFEKFKKELSSNEINFSKESYGMDWLGKSYARLLAADPAKTLLRENTEWNSKEENKKSENLLIKGDNLEVLKHLSNAYHEKVKMIYIDPPYNTGSDRFVYEDDRKFTVKELQNLIGVDAEKAKRILDFTQQKSNSHSAWLTFLYPRLHIAKQLLKDEGVIFISIDDNEITQLRLLMDEIFGEENFIGNIIWNNVTDNNPTNIAIEHEYILCYCKEKVKLAPFWRSSISEIKDLLVKVGEEFTSKYENQEELQMNYSKWFREHKSQLWPLENYKFIDKDGVYSGERGVHNPGKEGYRYDIIHPITGKPCKQPLMGYRFPKTTMDEMIAEGRIIFGEDEDKLVEIKVYAKDYLQKLSSILQIDGRAGANELRDLFPSIKKVFTNPKTVQLLEELISFACNSNDLILDYFAGSGTTADAIMQLNAVDKGNRKYVLVQLPEPIDSKKNKEAYDFVKNELGIADPTIFEITKERLIRAGKRIGDTSGFKIFETMPIWEDYEFEAKEFAAQTKLFDESKLSGEDLQTLLITWKTYDNIALTESLVSVNLDGYTGHYGNGRLYLMNKGFEIKHLKALLNKIDEDTTFNPISIIVFGYHFESKALREIAENVSNYANKKKLDIDFITRY